LRFLAGRAISILSPFPMASAATDKKKNLSGLWGALIMLKDFNREPFKIAHKTKLQPEP
jgi:hypothetical protein